MTEVSTSEAAGRVVTPTAYSVSWNLTRRCNLRCAHCYLSAGPGAPTSGEFSVEECRRIIDEIAQVNPTVFLILTGGEPLLRKDLFDVAAAAPEFLSCSSCHIGEEQPEGNPDEWAPDSRVAGRRLNPDWIVRWLQDPQRLSPGTKMPSFFADERSGPEDILDGDEERQMLALRDYILNLGGGGSRDPRELLGPSRVGAEPSPGPGDEAGPRRRGRRERAGAPARVLRSSLAPL